MKGAGAFVFGIAMSSAIAAGLGERRTAELTPTRANFTELRRQLDTGTAVTEYMDRAGLVFAVSWTGPFLPDLAELLGSWYPTFAEHGKRRGASHQLSVELPEVVIHSTGVMGAFRGRAWLPAQLPAGFDPQAAP